MSHRFTNRPLRGGGLLLGLLVLALGAWLPAAAQGPGLTISQATLRLWSEYDEPGLLVIFAGEFAGNVSFPQPVVFPLPVGARGIQATAQDATGALLTQPWQIVEGKLSYTLPQPKFHVEYYLDRPLSGEQRELTYTFQAPYPIQALEITVQQPARATGFTMTPQPASSSQGNDGFAYYRLSRSNLAAGDKLDLALRYTKSDQRPSITPAPAQTPTPNEINAIAKELWCPLCNGVRLDNCELQACIQMREVIAQKLVAGESKAQIKAYFVQQYGDVVLGMPASQGFNLVAWGLPVLAGLVALGLLAYIVRLWVRRRPAAGAVAAPGTRPALSSTDDYLKRVDEELKKYE